eukprot:TRINITY_DN12184_c0_g1_i1.p1 TRINITY_DN12184_c0_g1~~TRINITY_DN12184_c0_g1_i1.p1  ORF type:complete len:265 (+),score=72.71 TRINITY_DN12184_c0_g1_i1:213-1007(+)
MDPLQAMKANAGNRRSTVAELEECLNNSFLADTHKCFQNPQVKSAIGRVSFAVQFEKSGLASIEEAEDAYSKAATAISDVLSLPEVQQNEESRYWLKLFELHVNKHLHEIVLLADSNKKKPPAHYDRLEEENLQLKEDITYLKQLVSDLNAELDLFKNANGGVVPQPNGTRDGHSALTTSSNLPVARVLDFDLRRSVDVPKKDQDDVDSEVEKMLKRFDRAKSLVDDLKTFDRSIQKSLELYGQLIADASASFLTSGAVVASNK